MVYYYYYYYYYYYFNHDIYKYVRCLIQTMLVCYAVLQCSVFKLYATCNVISYDKRIVHITIIITIIIIYRIPDIYNYVPETKFLGYANVAAILWLEFMVHVMLLRTTNVLYVFL